MSDASPITGSMMLLPSQALKRSLIKNTYSGREKLIVLQWIWTCTFEFQLVLVVWWALMRNLCLISYLWYDVEKLTVPGSSNLNSSFKGHSKTFCVKKMEEKCVTFCFIKLNATVSPKSFGKGDFSVQKLGLFF